MEYNISNGGADLTDLTDKALLDELNAAVHALRGDYVQQKDLEHYSNITAEIAHRLHSSTK